MSESNPECALGWSWTQIPRRDASTVVTQANEFGCGAACASMLLADRGFAISQEQITAGVPLPASAQDLAARMQELSGIPWIGAFANVEVPTIRTVRGICTERGSWAALLEPFGYRQIGHWVVVDGVSREGVVWIRDPRGLAYGMPLTEFLELWRYTMMVIEEVTP